MKLLLVILAVVWADFDVNRIATINKIKEEAQAAYLDHDYQTAVQKYLLLTDSLNVKDENILLNLSNAYFQLNDSTNAVSNYQKLLNSGDAEIRSRAFQQLGVLADQKNQLTAALDMFKESLKANPGNEESRYNYELTKKKLENQPKQDQQDKKNKDKNEQENQDQNQQQDQDQNPDQENQDQQSQENQNQEQHHWIAFSLRNFNRYYFWFELSGLGGFS